MKPAPNAKATILRCLISMAMFVEYSIEDDSSSEVINRIIAMTASQRLMSDIERGKFIF
jgi:hypothetical protein